MCGKITPNGDPLVIGGAAAQRGELPWHVGIYRKNVKPYLQICGGSIITTDLVVSGKCWTMYTVYLAFNWRYDGKVFQLINYQQVLNLTPNVDKYTIFFYEF